MPASTSNPPIIGKYFEIKREKRNQWIILANLFAKAELETFEIVLIELIYNIYGMVYGELSSA